ncbi:MAG: ABC transporter substrate-binding protein [Oscillospiraceae bacterium]
MKKKILAIALVSMMSLGLFAGCGDKKDGGDTTVTEKDTTTVAGDKEETTAKAKPVELKVITGYGGSDGNKANYENAYKAYEQESGNTIKDASVTYNEDTKLQVMTDFETGSEPDVVMYFDGTDSNPLVTGGKLVDIETIRAEYPDYATNMDEARMNKSPADGKYYSIPVNGFYEGMFVNTKVLADCGVDLPNESTTWEQFMASCETIKGKNYTPIAVSMAEEPGYWFEFCTYNHLAASNLNIMPKTFDDVQGKAWVAGVGDLKSCFEKGYLPKNTNSTTAAEAYKLLTDGKAAFYVDGSWKVGAFEKDMADRLDEVTYTLVPGSADGRKATDIVGGISSGYMITKKGWDSDKKDAAVSFISYMTSDEVIGTFCTAGQVTALKNAPPAPAGASSLVQAAMAANGKATSISGAVEDNMEAAGVRTPFFKNFSKVMTGATTGEKIVTDVLAAHYASLK